MKLFVEKLFFVGNFLETNILHAFNIEESASSKNNREK